MEVCTVDICTKAVKGNLSHMFVLWMTEGEQGGGAGGASKASNYQDEPILKDRNLTLGSY